MSKASHIVTGFCALVLGVHIGLTTSQSPPKTNVVKEVFVEKVPYFHKCVESPSMPNARRWLEEPNGEIYARPRVRRWNDPKILHIEKPKKEKSRD